MATPKVGLYLRLSRDDENGSAESMSIANQRAFLLRWVQAQKWTVADIYADDGFTGTNFDRPDFQRLLKDIEAKKINTVLTKDLSRLGRDQIGTLYYLQVYFPAKRVRYIAVNEGIDTAGDSGMGGIATPFLAAANDFYTADISRKVRTALNTRKQAGLFIGSSPPLGYLKDPNQKGHLIPDPETAWVVRRIFREFLLSGSVIGVAKGLTEEKVPTPSGQKQLRPGQTRFPGTWSTTMVRRILTNPTYAGHLTQNRRRKVSYKARQYENLPRDQWVVVKNTHEPLVTQEEFDQAQELLKTRSYSSKRGQPHLLTGLVFCADCGSPMTYVRNGPTRTYMVCQGYRAGGRLHLCTAHLMREDKVIESIRQQLRELARQLDADTLEETTRPDRGQAQTEQWKRKLEQQYENCKRIGSSLYRDKVAGTLTEAEFQELFEENRDERKRLEEQLERCNSQMEHEADQSEWKEQVRKFLSFDELDRGTLTALMEKILVYEDKTLEIIFRFRKPA